MIRQLTDIRHGVQLFTAVIVLIVGCITLILGFFVPPKGEIHPSVLVAFGEILTFTGTVLGIDYHYKLKIKD